MTDQLTFSSVDHLISELRHGRMVLMMLDDSDGDATGIVVLGAEFCEPDHITFMARQARGLVCLGMTRARCEQLNLPLMVEGGKGDAAPFTLSIEAAVGIDTGISAADRARTVRVAVAPDAQASDLVQPGHIFPIAAAEGGVLVRTDRAEASTDLAKLAGLMQAAVFTDVLDTEGNLATGEALTAFAEKHQLPIGRVSDLVQHQLNNEETIERVRAGEVQTPYGAMALSVYQERGNGLVHFALSRGDISAETPTLVRVHVASALRDLVGTTLEGHSSWRFSDSLAAVADSAPAVLVLISKPETGAELLADVDRLLGQRPVHNTQVTSGYASVGLGAQILRDLGVGQIKLMGAPLKYNALAGFGLEVVEFVEPTA